jgi:hypothetical protein
MGRRSRIALVVIVVLLAGAAIGGLVRFGPKRPPAGVTMSDLAGVQQLRDRFDADKGAVRLVVIFSPT